MNRVENPASQPDLKKIAKETKKTVKELIDERKGNWIRLKWPDKSQPVSSELIAEWVHAYECLRTCHPKLYVAVMTKIAENEAKNYQEYLKLLYPPESA